MQRFGIHALSPWSEQRDELNVSVTYHATAPSSVRRWWRGQRVLLNVGIVVNLQIPFLVSCSRNSCKLSSIRVIGMLVCESSPSALQALTHGFAISESKHDKTEEEVEEQHGEKQDKKDEDGVKCGGRNSIRSCHGDICDRRQDAHWGSLLKYLHVVITTVNRVPETKHPINFRLVCGSALCGNRRRCAASDACFGLALRCLLLLQS